MAFHTLPIATVERETPDAVVLGFDVPPALAERFRFTPGQYLTLRATIDGEDVRRSYSLCSQPGEPPRVGIKRIEGGRFSTFAHERLEPGDTLEVMPPAGRFVRAEEAGGLHHVAFAAGSGITPILAIVTDVLERDPRDTVTLFYGNRTMRSLMFLEALHRAKDRFLGRLSLHHFLSREAMDSPLFRGRLDREKVAALAASGLLDPARLDVAYICGPGTMIDEVCAGLEALAVPAEKIRLERFADAGAPRRSPAPAPAPGTAAEGAVRVDVALDGHRRSFELRPGESVIEAGERAGVDIPWSCGGGMCSTCRCKLVKGDAEMRINYSLEPWELERGYILACQAVPGSEHLELDFDDQ